MPLEEWQAQLRKQFVVYLKLEVSNIGDHPVFSDFEVYNPVILSSASITEKNEGSG